MKRVVVLTGAGISAESGISTFRDSGGLWEQHRVEDVASIDGWHRNAELVQDFYNQRSNTTVQKHQFFGAQLSSQSNSHIHTRPLDKT